MGWHLLVFVRDIGRVGCLAPLDWRSKPPAQPSTGGETYAQLLLHSLIVGHLSLCVWSSYRLIHVSHYYPITCQHSGRLGKGVVFWVLFHYCTIAIWGVLFVGARCLLLPFSRSSGLLFCASYYFTIFNGQKKGATQGLLRMIPQQSFCNQVRYY